MKKKPCFYCGGHFYPVRSDQMYCSKHCWQQSRRKHSAIILPIKKKWFHMILSGEKKEEYRERKPYWEKRFKQYFSYSYGPVSDEADAPFKWRFPKYKKEIIFRNGYRKNAPQFTAYGHMEEKEGKPEWGAVPGEIYYTFIIDTIYDKRNC